MLVATPGRLLDFIGEGEIDLSDVQTFILDEADRMLDMGFIPDVRRIAALVRNRRQTVLFSATMPAPVEALSREFLGEAERIAVAPQEITVERIKQSVLHVAREDKSTLLPELIRDRNMFRVLVFMRTKHRAARLAKALRKTGIASDEIHGNRSQNQRQNALERFRSGRVQVLVCTDVAARGRGNGGRGGGPGRSRGTASAGRSGGSARAPKPGGSRSGGGAGSRGRRPGRRS